MSKGLSAEELVDQIEIKKIKRKQRAYEVLRAACISAINQMGDEGQYTTEIEIRDSDLPALTQVTEELRELNYKFRFIEIQNSSGEVQQHKLFISVEHAR